MKKSNLLLFALIMVASISRAQLTANQFKGLDCNGYPVNLFSDLDAGKAVILFYYMPNCGACPPPAQKIQNMANAINSKYPGKVKGYAFPYQNSTTCDYSSTWVSSSSLSTIYTPMDSGATDVAYYGGFGMPTVVLVGGKDHKVLFSTLDFSTSDTTIMRDKILQLINASLGINTMNNSISTVSLFPNPARNILNLEIEIRQTLYLKIEIVNILGEVVSNVFEEKSFIGNLNKEIDTENLPNAVYILRVNSGNNTNSYRFIVSH